MASNSKCPPPRARQRKRASNLQLFNMKLKRLQPDGTLKRVPNPKTNFISLFGLDRETNQPKEEPPIIDLPIALNNPSESFHYNLVNKRQSSWESLRQFFLSIGEESQLPPAAVKCCICEETCSDNGYGIARCEDCGPNSIFCSKDCCEVHHRHVLWHHSEIWEGNLFVPLVLPTPCIRRPDGHFCASSAMKDIVVIDKNGRQHKASINLCLCERDATTFLRCNLWPATPDRPAVGFHLSFMEMLVVLQLQCQNSVHALSEAFKVLSQSSMRQNLVSNIYRLLTNDCLDEYKEYRLKMRSLSHIVPELDNGTTCPVCPETNRIISLDGNFGLCRKKSAGRSLKRPRLEDMFFINQDAVDEFVTSYQTGSRDDKGLCSDFKAGNSIKSARKMAKLDQTGVFGSACRHEWPLKFFSLKHGERLSYPVFMVKNLVNEDMRGHIMYDIACSLDAHLKKNDPALAERLQFSIPIFHSYGHKVKCQLEYGPKRQEGLGLTDGETLERLWSYLRKFAKITKEMTSSHRQDLLSEALFFYSEKLMCNMAYKLTSRMDRMLQQQEEAEINLSAALTETNETITPALLSKWEEDEKSVYQHDKSGAPDWKEQYALQLYELYQIDPIIPNESVESDVNHLEIQTQIKSIEESLAKTEKRNSVDCRWPMTSVMYTTYLAKAIDSKRRKLLTGLKVEAVDRNRLKLTMARYADGQAIAKRISGQMTKVANRMKKLVKLYNSLPDIISDEFPKRIDFESISNPMNELFLTCEVGNAFVNTRIQSNILEKANSKKRVEEDIAMINIEMNKFSSFLKSQIEMISSHLTSEALSDGQKALLRKKMVFIQQNREIAEKLFSKYLNDLNVTQLEKIEDESEEGQYLAAILEEFNDAIEMSDDDDDDDDV